MGDDRRITHCINIARDATFVASKNNRIGAAIQDNDCKATFDLMIALWPIMVLCKKGCREKFKEILEMLFDDVCSIVVVNNVQGRKIKLERSLRQGDIPSMLLFAYGIDPYLTRLIKN